MIFAPTTGGARKMCEEMGVPFLGSIPLDPKIARSCDEGKSFISQAPDAVASKAYEAIFKRTNFFSSEKRNNTSFHFSDSLLFRYH